MLGLEMGRDRHETGGHDLNIPLEFGHVVGYNRPLDCYQLRKTPIWALPPYPCGAPSLSCSAW